MSVPNPEILRQLQALFTAHDAAIEGCGGQYRMGRAIQAHDAAAVAALEANRAAIRVLRLIQGEGEER